MHKTNFPLASKLLLWNLSFDVLFLTQFFFSFWLANRKVLMISIWRFHSRRNHRIVLRPFAQGGKQVPEHCAHFVLILYVALISKRMHLIRMLEILRNEPIAVCERAKCKWVVFVAFVQDKNGIRIEKRIYTHPFVLVKIVVSEIQKKMGAERAKV